MSTATSLVWLLREGFRNEVMNEYLAHLAATTGDLYTALLDPEPDEALLDGAGGIIDALCAAGGASLDGYAPQRGHRQRLRRVLDGSRAAMPLESVVNIHLCGVGDV